MNTRLDPGLIPWHSEAEQSVLGALLLDNAAWDRVADLLTERSFYEQRNAIIYTAIGGLVNANKAADVITVLDRLQGDMQARDCGGLEYLNALAQCVPSAANARRHAEIVAAKAAERALIALADEALSIAVGPGEAAEKRERIDALFSELHRKSSRAPVLLAGLLVSAMDRCNDLAEGTVTAAWPTGIASLDRVLNGGLRPGKVYGIAARPSVGKSSLARAIGLHTAKNGHPTLLMTMEMPGDEVADCSIAQLAAIPSDRLQTGKLDDADWGALSAAVDEGSRLPFYVDDQGGLTIGQMRMKARMVKGLRVLLVDYLQLAGTTLKNATRNDQVEEISRGLKALAMSLNIAVVVLSQLNREVERRADKEPQLSDLRDSGAIEQDLDVVVMLWTCREFDEGARRIVGCKVPKHRGGPKGRFALEFKAETYHWYESTASLDPPTATERRGGFE